MFHVRGFIDGHFWLILKLSYVRNIGNNPGGDHCAVWD